MIEFRGITKAFSGKEVLKGVDLTVLDGEVLFIIGTSGVGKSVTIKHLIGLLRVDDGQILVDGKRVDNLTEKQFFDVRKRIGMVFQNATLFDSLTLQENVALPLRKHRNMSQKEALVEASKLLAEVHMSEFEDRYPSELSDGMRKRAAIARTLSLEPEVVLFDEPTTGLDPVSARRIDRLIRRLADDQNRTCVVVSHDLASIFSIADRISFVYQGKIYRTGTREEFKNSDDPIIEQFINGRPEGPMETPGF